MISKLESWWRRQMKVTMGRLLCPPSVGLLGCVHCTYSHHTDDQRKYQVLCLNDWLVSKRQQNRGVIPTTGCSSPSLHAPPPPHIWIQWCWVCSLWTTSTEGRALFKSWIWGVIQGQSPDFHYYKLHFVIIGRESLLFPDTLTVSHWLTMIVSQTSGYQNTPICFVISDFIFSFWVKSQWQEEEKLASLVLNSLIVTI